MVKEAMLPRDGSGARADLKDGVFTSTPHGFVLPHCRPAPHDRKNFLTSSPPLRTSRSPAPLRKTLLLVNFLTIITIFLINSILLIKIYLKLQINLSHQIKLFFSKNWIILLKCLTRQYHNRNKNLIIPNQWFNSI